MKDLEAFWIETEDFAAAHENIRNIPESQRFQVVLTNPPFGGKEGRHIQQNFPIQSQATELLALQYVMKKLGVNARCGIVVPEGVLFRGDAFAAFSLNALVPPKKSGTTN